jgi:hypothetical protein
MFSRHVSPPHDHTTLSSKLHRAVPNILQEFDGGMESRTTPNQEGEDDEESTYGVRFRRSLYGWKDNFITFPMSMDSGP